MSPTWDVFHEPKSAKCPSRAQDVDFQMERWPQRKNYGEVNSYMRWAFLEIPADKKALVIRDPFDLTRTIYNRKKGMLPERIKEELVWVFKHLVKWAHTMHFPCFYFEDFTKNVQTVRSMAQFMGIYDLELPETHCDKPVNATPDKKNLIRNFSGLPEDIKHWAHNNLGIYREQFYHEDGTPLIDMPSGD
jgi:hypothetical protein